MCQVSEFHAVTVRGLLRAQHIATTLIGDSIWCDVTPLPGDETQIRVKGHDREWLERICARPTHEFNTVVMHRPAFVQWLRTAAGRQSELEPEMGPEAATGNAVLVTVDEYERSVNDGQLRRRELSAAQRCGRHQALICDVRYGSHLQSLLPD